MHPDDRYQIGDEVCGQVERTARKGDAFAIAHRHAREHNNLRVRVMDCMAKKNQYCIAWEFWVGPGGGESYRAVTNLELERKPWNF